MDLSFLHNNIIRQYIGTQLNNHVCVYRPLHNIPECIVQGEVTLEKPASLLVVSIFICSLKL